MNAVRKAVLFLLLLGLMLPAHAIPSNIVLAQDTEEEEPQLVTAKATAEIVQDGRVLMHARTNRWVYDSVPPLGGPNEEVNPLDGMLAALISCGMYIYEAVGIEEGIETNNLSSTVQGEIDGRGVAGAPVNPRVRTFHATINVDGPTPDQAAMMAEAFSKRCPIYTTLALSADITVINVVDGEEQEPISTEADPIVEKDIDGEMPELAMPGASGYMIEFGRSVMMARGNRWINDSVPPINGPNEEVNPLDMFIGALPACGLMIYEAVARDEGIPLHFAKATVEADLDPRGVAGANVNPRIRDFRVNFHINGPSAAEAEMMAAEFSTRCPIYTTFERSAPIAVEHTFVTEKGDMIREVNFDFGTHPQLGFAEQHVLVQQDGLDETMGMRLTPEETEDPANLEREIFLAGADVGHDPFGVGENPNGPFPLGEPLGMTLGDWLAASGSGTYRMAGDHGEVSLSLQNMVPNGTYTLWCTRITVPPEFLMVNKACGPLDGSENTFMADEEGNVDFSMETWALDDTSAETVSVFAIAYHSDGQTYGEYSGDFGTVAHVQVFTILPPFADEAWTILDANEVMDEEAMNEADTAGFAALFHGIANPDHLDELTTAQALLAQESRKEPGTIRYDFYQQKDDPTQIMLLAIWESEADFQAHVSGEVHTSYADSLPEGAWDTPPSMTQLVALER